MIRKILSIFAFSTCLLLNISVQAQKTNEISKSWVADNGDGTYANPVLYADYSNPDAVRPFCTHAIWSTGN